MWSAVNSMPPMFSFMSLIKHVKGRIKARMEPGGRLLEISLEIDKQSISRILQVLYYVVSCSAHATLIHKTLLSVLTKCLLNSTCVIYVAAHNHNSIRRGSENCFFISQ